MMKLVISVFLSAIVTLSVSEDKKWVWGENNKEQIERSSTRVAKDYLSRVPLQRYEIYENDGFSGHRPQRPHDFRPPVDYPHRPSHLGLNRPNYVGVRPGGGHGSYGQGFGGSGVLTGPVASWEREPLNQDFDKCKCTEKFNCKSPGISYGHCDVGKKYCCYSSDGHVHDAGIPPRPVHSVHNGVLAGPGGPVDYNPGLVGYHPSHFGQGSAGGYGNPAGLIGRPPGGGPGVLVGPSGPTGIIGGPAGHNPGVLIGPGGPTGVIGRPPHYGGTPFRPGVHVGPGGSQGIYAGNFGNYGPLTFGLGRSAKNTKSVSEEDDKNE